MKCYTDTETSVIEKYSCGAMHAIAGSEHSFMKRKIDRPPLIKEPRRQIILPSGEAERYAKSQIHMTVK